MSILAESTSQNQHYYKRVADGSDVSGMRCWYAPDLGLSFQAENSAAQRNTATVLLSEDLLLASLLCLKWIPSLFQTWQ